MTDNEVLELTEEQLDIVIGGWNYDRSIVVTNTFDFNRKVNQSFNYYIRLNSGRKNNLDNGLHYDC